MKRSGWPAVNSTRSLQDRSGNGITIGGATSAKQDEDSEKAAREEALEALEASEKVPEEEIPQTRD
ncbi:hypothetical protein PT974_03302 [Cladobotryum mycophilum]|uniref:Uncharacterized protein n=1 Tax=Cladobotryum mycophilum TaxID=491253 RepID=A0ABR0SRX2_9HYPO